MGGLGPTGGEKPGVVRQSRAGDDVYNLPTELFDALGIKGKSGKTLKAATSRPRGGLIGREYWDMMDYAHQVADKLTPEMRKKYGIVLGTNPYAGQNPWGYPGSGKTPSKSLVSAPPAAPEEATLSVGAVPGEDEILTSLLG